ncbi:DNA-binding protein [Turkeypox virus]|uniref:DNA-binding protein n=1 Tax=Turkeypox virus TaxID=336486 RepID=A0A0M3ZEK2_9POXV|nr:DNA-binding protein [Turkeypox virus]ALA62431.2 DNA-binding protein [Turkeypox virus]
MNNFIKQISLKIKKPVTELDNTSNADIYYHYVTIMFNFPNMYYSNTNLFNKPENNLLDISKSLMSLNSFSYEFFVIKEYVKLIRRYAHIYDIYFIPIGWLVGCGDPVEYHTCIKLIRSNTQNIIESITKKYLAQHGIHGNEISIQYDKSNEVKICRYPILSSNKRLEPICVVSFYPFDPENKIILIIYVGRHKDKHCGISYVIDREDTYQALTRIYPYVDCIYLLSDDIITFHTIPIINNTKNLKKLPIEYCTTLCELVYEFEYSKFDQGNISIPAFIPFIPKQLVSIINLPDNVNIMCASANNIEYVTHIDNKKLNRILIIKKDKFLKNTVLRGTFKKINIVRHGKYTYTIISSSFDCPKLENPKSSSPISCNKIIQDGSKYVTKTFNDVI